MDLDELKAKFKHKTRADLQDVDLALKAVPFLVREVERIETLLRESEEKYQHLSELFGKKRPPLERKGKKAEASWRVWADEASNRLYIELQGVFDYSFAKQASNGVITVLPNLRNGFDVINNISKLDNFKDKRVLFHLRKVMYHIKDLGAGQIIRVAAPDKPELNGLFDAGAKEVGLKVHTAESLKKAESMIENVGRFLKA